MNLGTRFLGAKNVECGRLLCHGQFISNRIEYKAVHLYINGLKASIFSWLIQ